MSLLKKSGCLIVLVLFSGIARGQGWQTIKVQGSGSLTVGATATVYTACGVTASSNGACAVAIPSGLAWSSSDTSVITIDASTGAATGKKAGTATIFAKDPNSPVGGGLDVTVSAAATLTDFRIVPTNNVTVQAGQTVTVGVEGIYGSGANISNSPVTSGVTWNPTLGPTTATVSGGIVSGLAPGLTTFTVSVGTLPAKTVSVTVTAAATASNAPSAVGALKAGATTFYVSGTVGHNITVFKAASDATKCDQTTPASGTILLQGTSASPTVALANPTSGPAGPPFVVTMNQSLSAKSSVCIEDSGTTAAPLSTPLWSALVTVKDQDQTANSPKLVTKVTGLTLSVTDFPSDTLSVYQYEPGYNVEDCKKADDDSAKGVDKPANHRTQMTMVVSSTSNSTVFTPTPALTTPGPVTLTFTSAVSPGSTLCVAETTPGLLASWSDPIVVPDDNDFGRFRTYFTAGVQASNQLSTTGTSSTAGEYLEGGFVSSWVRAQDATERTAAKQAALKNTLNYHGRPGLMTVTDIRLSPIPVSAPQTTTTTTTTTAPATTATAPNSLSSQQSVRTTLAVYTPWRLTNWHNRADYFTVAPAVRAGFGTLLDPTSSASSSTGSTSAGSTQTVTTQYQSAYYFWAAGARLAWDRYSTDTDKASQTMTQVYVTFGQYSNLPSYVCIPTVAANVPSSTTTTACNQGKYAPNPTATPPAYYTYGRSLVPRIDLEAFARLPGYPFVLGIDANLQQYGLGGRSNLDYLNKPGNDIRIYVGLQISFSALIAKLGGGVN